MPQPGDQTLESLILLEAHLGTKSNSRNTALGACYEQNNTLSKFKVEIPIPNETIFGLLKIKSMLNGVIKVQIFYE